MDAVWDGRSDGFRGEAGSLDFGIGPRQGVILGENLGRLIVTNDDFAVYLCKNA